MIIKNLLFILIALVFLFSCSKEQEVQVHELKIYQLPVDSISGINKISISGVKIYPNPFFSIVSIECRASSTSEIIISDDNGGMKKITPTSNRTTLDFSQEKNGTYYCEVFVNNTVYRTYLIKDAR